MGDGVKSGLVWASMMGLYLVNADAAIIGKARGRVNSL